MNDQAAADAEFEKHLVTIEQQIHKAGNRTRHAMYMTLIAIGIRNDRLRPLALAAAGRIGKVEVDHGETGCKTPDAAAYIRNAVERQRKAARPRAKKAARG